MSLLNKSLKLGIASLKKPVMKAHPPDGELRPSSTIRVGEHSAGGEKEIPWKLS
jgi:hypothetical protein